MHKQYLFEITKNGRTIREWYAPSDTRRLVANSDLDAAHMMARELHHDAEFIAAVRDNTGKLVVFP